MVARASYGARSMWFQSLGRWEVSRMLRALTPCAEAAKSPLPVRVGFDNLVQEDAFERLRDRIPAQPDDKSRA